MPDTTSSRTATAVRPALGGPGTAAAPALQPFVAAPHPLVRVNPTPAATLCPARSAHDALLLERLRALIAAQRDSSTDLTDLLYAAAAEADRETRNAVLLPLRRAIHNGRLPRRPVEAPVLAALGRCGQSVAVWLQRQARVEALRDELGAGYDEALHEERQHLRVVLGNAALLRSLAVSSEFLPRVAGQYSAAPWAELSKRTRKSEETLLRYGMRAGTKTSPFSQYTVVGFLGGPAGDPDPLSTESTVEVNRALLRRVEAGLLRLPASRDRVRVHSSAGLRHRGGTLVARGDRDQLGADAAGITERYGEAQVTVPASPAVLTLLQWLDRRDDGCATVGELAALIGTKVPGADAGAATAFVTRLVECGVLAASPIVDEQAPDALDALCGWLDGWASTACPALDDGLRAMATGQHEFADAGPARRVELIRAARQQRDEVLRTLGDDIADRPAPEPVWYEDCRLVGRVPGGASDWSPVLDDCRRLLDVLGVFDEQHVFSRVLSNRFVERFGPGGTTTELDTLGELFLPAYGDALQLTEGFDHDLIRTDPVIAELVGLRRRILEPLVAQLGKARPGDGPVVLDPGWRDVVAAQAPAWVRSTPSSHSVFLQPLGGDPPTGAVLNKIYNGWGNYLSRFLATAPAEVLATVRGNARRHLPGTDTVAELRPVQGFNANVHPLLGDADLDFDRRGTAGSIPMHRLAVRHDPRTERVELWDAGTGRRVHPLYLGFLIPYYLPSHLVPLTAMAGSGSIMFEPQVSADRDASVDRGTVRYYPRVMFGSLCLARARWHVPAEQVPRAEPGGTAPEYFVRLNEWRVAQGMPEHVFVHPPAPELDPGKVNDYFGSYIGNRKPQYVALLSRLHVRHLERLLVEQPGTDVVIEEALPAPPDAFPVAGTPHATELVAEFYRHARSEGEDHS